MVAKNFQFEFKRRGGDGDPWVSGKRPVGAFMGLKKKQVDMMDLVIQSDLFGMVK